MTYHLYTTSNNYFVFFLSFLVKKVEKKEFYLIKGTRFFYKNIKTKGSLLMFLICS